jgi:hypothetical protein
MDVLSEAECAQWRARGFVAVPALFAPALVEQAVGEADAAASVLGFPSREAPATNEIALSPRLTRAAGQLLGTAEIRLFESRVLPAGHREDGDAYRREHIDPLFDVSLAETLAPLPAGSVIFHSCRCLHSSLPNRSNRQRRAHVMHLMQPGTTGHDGAVLVRSQAICRCLRFLDLF